MERVRAANTDMAAAVEKQAHWQALFNETKMVVEVRLARQPAVAR